MFKSGVCSEDGVVGFDNRGRVLGSRVDGEFELGLLAKVNREALQEKGTKTGTSTTTKGVCEEEALETRTVVSNTSDSVHNLVNKLLTNSVVTTGVVIGGIFVSSDELFRVEKVSVFSSADLIDYIRFKIDVNSSGDIFSVT